MARWTNFLKMARVLTSLPSAGTIALHGKLDPRREDKGHHTTWARSTQSPRSEPGARVCVQKPYARVLSGVSMVYRDGRVCGLIREHI
jgi:hypothetical protein